MLGMTFASAATLYWDSNGTATAGAGATPTGTWGSSVFWTTDSTGANVGAPTLISATTNVDDLFFVAGPGAASGNNSYTVTVSGAQAANSLTFQASGATTVSGGTSITLGNGNPAAGGIMRNTNAFGTTAQGGATINTAIVLNNSQTWTNNATTAMSFGANLSLGANTLTFAGTGGFTWTTGSFGNAGSGGIIMNSSGVLNVRAATNSNYTGSTTINSGVVLLNGGSKPTGNFTLNGGMVTDYFQQTGAFTSGLGTGTNQIQIYGESGFGAGNGTSVWRIGSAGSVLIWGASGEGSATGFFNPTTLKFMTSADNLGPTIYGIVNFDNGLNLNGATRTIDVLNASANPTTSGASIAGVISNGSLIKTGGGNLTLGNSANTYGGSTTISGGFLTVGSTGALGSASNSLIFNGGTLRASGTVTSPATRSVTMTQTGIFDNNGQAISIAGNIGGSGGLTKNGTGALTLTGTNTYGGVTTVNAGSLVITKEASLASNTAANLNVKSGATLQLNVDSAGAAGFSVSSLNTLLANISVANTSEQGLQLGATVALDTSTASGGTFTQGNAIGNSSGAFGGVIAFTKLGTNSLIIDKVNTYSGVTTISAGTLQLNSGGVIARSVINNAAFVINSNDAVTQGTHFGLISGTGTLTNNGAGVLTLNQANTFTGNTTVSSGTISITNPLALQNSAYNTTGSNGSTVGLDVTSGLSSGSLTLGGLSGSVDLASAFTSGFTGSVTNLILNPQAGITSTYGGVIANGNMSLTKTGAGTQVLTGANTYTGPTIINAGTLTIGVGGSLSSTSDLQISGGSFSYGNTSSDMSLNGLTVSGGNASLGNSAAGRTLALGAITRSSNLFGTVNFTTLTGPISTTTGNVNGIIGPWATTGSGATLRYAVGSPDGSTATAISSFTGTAATANTLANVTDPTVNYEYSAAVAAMSAGTALTGNTLRYSGAAAATAINATSSLTLNGLMQAGTGILTISGGPSSGGILIGSTGELVISANTIGTTISAAIGGAGRLVYSGAGSRLLLSGTNTYTGGTVINSGQLAIASDAALGNVTGSITLNGGTLVGNNTNPQAGNGGGVNITSARDVIVGSAGGSIGAHGNNSFTTTGILSGSGTLTFTDVGGAGGRALNFNSTGNTFTGRIVIPSNTSSVSVNSLGADSVGSGNVSMNLGGANNGSSFAFGSGGTSALTFNNRAIELNASGAFSATIQNNNTTYPITIGSNLIATGAGAKTLTLNAVAGPTNLISSAISNGTGGIVSVTVSGAGNWALSGNNIYSGQTIVSSSTGATLTLSGDNSGMIGGVSLSTATATVTSAPRLNINSATALGTGVLNFGGGAATDVVRIDNTSAGAVTVSTANAITMNRNFTFVGTRDLNLGTGVITIGGLGGVPGIRNITVTANTLTLAGPIGEAAPGAAITKAGSGTLVLSGLNSYTGNTTVANSGGNLQIIAINWPDLAGKDGNRNRHLANECFWNEYFYKYLCQLWLIQRLVQRWYCQHSEYAGQYHLHRKYDNYFRRR
jgi:autotransporter-associated beta strand protein